MTKSILKSVTVMALMSFALVQDGIVWKAIPEREVEEVSREIGAFYTGKAQFSVNVVHQTYKGHGSNTPYDQSEGYVRRSGEQYHSYMLGVHTYQDKVVHFVVDSIQKTIVVSDKKNMAPQEGINLETALARENLLSCRKGVQDKKDVYRVDYKKGYTLQATELGVNADHSLAWITVYFREAVAVSNESDAARVQPKARIVYNGYNFAPRFTEKEFSHTTYFSIKEKKLVINNRYRNYQLLDNRITKNQTND